MDGYCYCIVSGKFLVSSLISIFCVDCTEYPKRGISDELMSVSGKASSWPDSVSLYTNSLYFEFHSYRTIEHVDAIYCRLTVF